MRILHVIPGDLWAGAESQLFYTLREIKRRKELSITTVVFNRTQLYHRLKEEDIKVVVFDENKHSSIEICRFIARLLSANNIDIIHTHEYKSHILGITAKAIALKHCPIVRTLHGRTSVSLTPKSIKSWFVLNIDRLFLRFFTQNILAVSDDLQSILINEYSRPLIYHINNAVRINRQDLSGVGAVRKNFGIPDSDFWVVTAARLVSIKNLNMLVEAVRLLDKKDRNRSFTVSIFGDGEMRESLEKQVKDYSLGGRVRFHGHYNEIYSVFNAADVFTLTSHHEGLPMSLLEAMSLGAIPVCTAVGGMKEVISHRENGFLVELGDNEKLADVLELIMNNEDKMEKIRDNAIRTISERYSLQKATTQLAELYENILKTG